MGTPSESTPAHDLWVVAEPIHAITYFDPGVLDALARAGTKGFWMGYFGARAAPMGAVAPGVVEATFFNFAPAMVRRAVPDVWGFVAPQALAAARLAANGDALAAHTAAVDVGVDVVVAAVAALEPVVDALDVSGRALAAANQAQPRADDPHQRLWQATTTLREHRGDGHVSLLVANGLDGLEAHVLQVADGVVGRERLQGARGWSDEEWDAAAARLVERGWLDRSGALSDLGRERRAAIDRATDELATPAGIDLAPVVEALAPIAAAVATADTIPYPNPIGLPPPATGR
jgi:hypothetical protein